MHSSPLCVDANLVIRLVADPGDVAVHGLWQQWDAGHRRLVAPSLLLYEVTNALYRYQRLGYLSAAAVDLALQAALALPIDLHGDGELHQQAPELTQRLDLPEAADAHYLALAQRLGAELWTADGQLARRVSPALAWVRVVGGE